MRFFVALFLLSITFASALNAKKSDEGESAQVCGCGNGIQEVLPYNFMNPNCPYKLYATDSINPQTQSHLYAVNAYDGQVIDIGAIAQSGTGMQIRRVTSLDFSPEGVLYALGTGTQNPYNNKSILMTIDCQTAQATVIGQTGVALATGTALTDMSFNQYGQLFVYKKQSPQNSVNEDRLGTINVSTGAYTEVGDPNFAQAEIGNGLTFAEFPTYPSQPLYQAGNFKLSKLDISTGMATPITDLIFFDPANNRPRTNGLEADFLTGIIYASINNKASGMSSPSENYLGTFNTTTGEFSFIKLPATLVQDGLDGLAFNRPYEECDGATPVPTGCVCGGDCYLDETNCSDLIDNDFDGLIDCEDPDCDAQSCEDGDLCTTGESCSAGSCLGAVAIDCNDSESCTDDTCDPSTGFCVNQGNDANLCTDSNQCTTDICLITGTCQSTNVSNGTSCDDGQACTSSDICTDGVCAGTPGIENCANGIDDDCDGLIDGLDPDCGGEICDDGVDNDGDLLVDCLDTLDCPTGTTCQDDGNPCTDNTCLATLCNATNNDSNTCSDGNDCTDDACSAGSCLSTNDDSNICSDGDACTNDLCSAGICNSTAIICDDGNECTTGACFLGSCQFTPLTNGTPCTADTNVCTDDYCQLGNCTHPNNTSPCDDGMTCTSGDVCSGGVCSGTPGVEICDNGIDDDCDDNIDEFDDDCAPSTLNVFITSTTYDGSFGNSKKFNNSETTLEVVTADSLCQARADAASLGGTWVALISDDTSNAFDRLINCNDKAWVMLSGPPNVIAHSKADLFDGVLDQAINVDEFGNNVGNNFVWTGTKPDGTAELSNNCNNWTSAKQFHRGYRGRSNYAGPVWIHYGVGNCNQPRHLYCFEIDTGC